MGEPITQQSIARWHFPNRIQLAQNRSIMEMLKAFPLECHWCKRTGNPKTMTISSSLAVQCLDAKRCSKERRKALGRPESPGEAEKKRSDAKGRSKAAEASVEAAEENLKKRCKSVYPKDESIRCNGPRGHGGEWHKNKRAKKRWPNE